MSYDISFAIKEQNTGELITIDSVANITYNVHDLIKYSSGWEIQNCQENGLVKDLIPKIMTGISELTTNPEKYRQYESPNGWGTIAGTINFYSNIFNAWLALDGDKYNKIKNYLYVYVS